MMKLLCDKMTTNNKNMIYYILYCGELMSEFSENL